jgi:hypothetical protein
VRKSFRYLLELVMTENTSTSFRAFGRLGFHEQLVTSLVALEKFLAQIRSATGREEIMALTLAAC